MCRAWLWMAGMIGTMMIQECFPAPQQNFRLDEVMSSSPAFDAATDTVVVRVERSTLDSLKGRLDFRIDAGYHTPPIHPYFRDEYRIIQDMRRLVLFVNRFALIGYESAPEMVEIARKFPVSKQTEIIRIAVAGSMANYASEIASRELRRKKLRWMQWELEKVVLRGALPFLHANLYNGVRERGFGLHLPAFRLSYSRQATKYFLNENVSWWPIRHFGFVYTRLDGRPIYTPILASRLGSIAVSYDKKFEIISSGYELRRSARVIVRLLYINHLQFPHANYMRSEVMLRW